MCILVPFTLAVSSMLIQDKDQVPNHVSIQVPEIKAVSCAIPPHPQLVTVCLTSFVRTDSRRLCFRRILEPLDAPHKGSGSGSICRLRSFAWQRSACAKKLDLDLLTEAYVRALSYTFLCAARLWSLVYFLPTGTTKVNAFVVHFPNKGLIFVLWSAKTQDPRSSRSCWCSSCLWFSFGWCAFRLGRT